MNRFRRKELKPERPVPEPGCESGQAFVGQVLVMAPLAIPLALGITVLILTG